MSTVENKLICWIKHTFYRLNKLFFGSQQIAWIISETNLVELFQSKNILDNLCW